MHPGIDKIARRSLGGDGKKKLQSDLPGWHFVENLYAGSHSSLVLVQNRHKQSAVIKRYHYDTTQLSDDQIQEFIEAVDKIRTIKCPGLITIYNAGLSSNMFYLLMEYLPGGNLAEAILSNSQLELDVRLDWFEQIAKAIAVLHDAGCLHRDIKPSNIMFRESGRLVLVDCGIENQWLLNAGFISEEEVYCTPSYVSPEMAAGEPCTIQSDIYSLGVIFYELLTGHKPFQGRDSLEVVKKHALAKIPRLPPEYAAFQELLDAMLSKHPDDRFRNASALQAVLHEIRKDVD